MSDFKERLHTEKKELDEKREKLAAFFPTDTFKKISPQQRGLLYIQLHVMDAYSQVLTERISLLG